MSEISDLTKSIANFANRRDWNIFHTPKNLAMAITGEAGELAAEFQWLTPEQASAVSGERLKAIELEIADIGIYLMRLCDVLDIDLKKAILDKIEINEKRFPPIK